jgi:hypothetical protein
LKRAILVLLLLPSIGLTQHKVDPRNTYQRLICVVPMTGTGTAADPKRPAYAPTTPASAAARQTGIIAYSQQTSDDGRFALVEYVAKDRSAFAPILADKSIKVFIKGDSTKGDIEKELKKYKKDFDLDKFGLVVP